MAGTCNKHSTFVVAEARLQAVLYFTLLVYWMHFTCTTTRFFEVASILDCVAAREAFELLLGMIPEGLSGVFDSTPPPKRKFEGQWSEKTILDKEIPMAEFLTKAIKLHPRPLSAKGLTKVLDATIRQVAATGSDISGWRGAQRTEISKVKKRIKHLNRDILCLVPEHGKGICSQMDFAFMYLVVQAIGYVDVFIVDNTLRGFPATGDIPSGGRFTPVVEPEVEPFTAEENRENFDMVSGRLNEMARKAMAAGRESSEWQAIEKLWDNVVGDDGEIAKGNMDGGPSKRGYTRRQIWDQFRNVPGGPRCLLRFGVWQKGKLRGCDDGLLCGHNARTRMHETISCLGADFPAVVARAFAEHSPGHTCWFGTDDVASAYRRVLCSMPQHTVVALWDPKEKDGVRYFRMAGFPFGLKSAVVAFNRAEAMIVEVARTLLLVPCGHYYDDVVVCEPRFAGRSGQSAMWFIQKAIGLPFAEEKHEKMRLANAWLGVISDFGASPGHVVMRVKPSRRKNLMTQLDDIIQRKTLTGAEAASLRGKLYFTSISAYGGIGRAPLQALSTRQYSKHGDTAVDDKLMGALCTMRSLLPKLPPRMIPLVCRGGDDGPG